LACLCEDETTVVPDLVGLEVLDGDVVHETEFDVEGFIEGDECLASVLPVVEKVTVLSQQAGSSWMDGPGGVLGWVETDDVLCELEDSGCHLTSLNDGTEVICCILVWGEGVRLDRWWWCTAYNLESRI
jgi:hypothetical protein